MMLRKANLIIFSIAVVVFSGTFLLSLVSFPSAGQNSGTSQHNPMSAGTPNVHSNFKIPKSGIHTFMGKSEGDIQKAFGQPERIDDTKYGYQWFIYGRNSESYVQIGIDKATRRVTTIYALGNKLETSPFAIGDHAKRIYEKVPVSDVVSMTYQGTMINFELNEEDMTVRPLIKFGGNWVQLNFDHVTDRLIGVRYMSPAVLFLQHPYSMTYEGVLPATPALSNGEWQAVNKAEDQEIFDLSNVLRVRFKEKPLQWSGAAYQAAFQHSEEMKQKNYFSHDSKWSGDLKTRLEKEKILFQVAGENIAARYPDAIAVTLGWLNSIDHRKNLLNGAYTELGVGSYQNYYTQDFVKPMIP